MIATVVLIDNKPDSPHTVASLLNIEQNYTGDLYL